MAMTWRPDGDLAEQLRVVAFLTGRSANEILNEALHDWLATKGKAASVKQAAERNRAALDRLADS